MAPKRKSNELKISRVYDAPVQAVWDAWTDPDQVKQWWGPRGFTLTTHSKDLRPGGSWVYTMHGPDGTDYPNITYYHEVRECEALVYDHGATKDTPPLFRVSVTFEAIGEKTAMEMTMTLETPEAAEQTRKFVKKAGGESTWDRLAEYLASEATGKEFFVINRTLESPMAQVQKMWTDPKHLVQWLPPEGMQMEHRKGSIEPGGVFFARMYNEAAEVHFRFEYKEITPTRIVYAQQFCDANGNVSRHPFAPVFPETLLTTVTFTPETDESTRITLTMEATGEVTPNEFEEFIRERSGMTKGWTGSFDKLENLLTGAEVPA